jgi:hypothetical protein
VPSRADVDDGEIVVTVDEIGDDAIELGLGMGVLLDGGRESVADGDIPTNKAVKSHGAA